VRSFKGPARDYDLTLRQADQARSDFAAITDDLECIMARLALVPRRRDFGWVALGAFVVGAACATVLNLAFWR
jgi:hypothetical protein